MSCLIRPSNVRVYQFRHLGRCHRDVGSEGLVPREGLEPTRPCGHWYLKPARLPIPPPRHGPARDRHRPSARRHVSTSQNRSDPSVTCRAVGPDDRVAEHDDLVRRRPAEAGSGPRELLLEGAVTRPSGRSTVPGCAGPLSSSSSSADPGRPMTFEPAGQRLARREQRVEVRVEADRACRRRPPGTRRSRAARHELAGCDRLDARRQADRRPVGGRPPRPPRRAPGSSSSVGLSTSMRQRLLGAREVPAVVVLRPAGGRERLRRGAAAVVEPRDRPPRRTSATSAGSGRSATAASAAERALDDRSAVDGREQRRSGPPESRTPGGSAAG